MRLLLDFCHNIGGFLSRRVDQQKSNCVDIRSTLSTIVHQHCRMFKHVAISMDVHEHQCCSTKVASCRRGLTVMFFHRWIWTYLATCRQNWQWTTGMWWSYTIWVWTISATWAAIMDRWWRPNWGRWITWSAPYTSKYQRLEAVHHYQLFSKVDEKYIFLRPYLSVYKARFPVIF